MIDRERIVEEVRHAAAGGGDPLAVRDVLERLVAQPGAPGGDADRTRYERLYSDENLTILHLVLPPGLASPIHDHRMWAVVGVYAGQEDNSFYRRSAAGLESSGGRELRAGDVVVLGDKTIHAIENPRDSYVAAIHVYGGDLFGSARSRYDLNGTEQAYDEASTANATLALAALEESLGRGLRNDEVRPLVSAFLDA